MTNHHQHVRCFRKLFAFNGYVRTVSAKICRMALRCSLALSLLLFCNSFAQNVVPDSSESRIIWEPPNAVEFPQNAKSSVPKAIIASLKVSEQPIVLEETDLAAVQKGIGGTIGNRGDASESLAWLCLHGSTPKGNWVLWLLSSEIDGGAVGGFRWQSVGRDTQFDARCQASKQSMQTIEIPLGLRIGMAETEALQILGRPTKRLGNTLFYLHEHEETLHNQPYTAMNTVTVRLRSGVVWDIEVWKSTTS